MPAMAQASAAAGAAAPISSWRALAIGERLIFPKVPSYRSAWASSVANARCTTITAPTWPWKRRDAVDLAVVDAPEDLQPAVDPLHRRAALVQPLELLGRARDAREAPQVDLLLHAHRQAVAPLAVAARVAGAVPASMPRRAAILQRAALGFMADVRHRVPHRRFADAVVAEDRAGLVVDDVQGRAAAEHLLGLLELEGAVLDQRLDALVVQELVHRAVVGRLVVGQRLDAVRRQIGSAPGSTSSAIRSLSPALVSVMW